MPVHFSRAVRTTRLDRDTRSFMERGFGEDFHNVTLSLREGNARPVASALGERVVLSARGYQPETGLGRLILAHELAHVIQKRRGAAGRAAASSALEAEAHVAASVVCSGGRFTCALADRSSAPRFWGEAGHYYTVYFVLLAAGVPNDTAAQMAFYAQMPDEVKEIDAVEAGIRYGLYLIDASRSSTGSRIAELFDRGPRVEMTHALHIQKGLHGLTGRASADETKVRTERLRRADFPSFAFGLGLHPFGDSFSHRTLDDEKVMYAAPVGHGLELRDPHAPDSAHKRPWLYKAYGLSLFALIREKSIGAPLVNEEGLEKHLTAIAEGADDAAQITKLRQAAKQLGSAMKDYAPEKQDLLPWAKFWPKYRGLSVDMLVQALVYATAWSSPSA